MSSDEFVSRGGFPVRKKSPLRIAWEGVKVAAMLACLAIIVLIVWQPGAKRAERSTATTATEAVSAARAEQAPQIEEDADLRISTTGLKKRGVPHHPDSPFFGEHGLVLRTLRRSDESLTWLPAEEVKAGCVPCFHALTFVALIDDKAYAINGSTRSWARQMIVALPDGRTLQVLDPYADGGPAEFRDDGNENAARFSRLIGEIEKTPGCQMDKQVSGSLQRQVDAVSQGICLPPG